MRFIGNDLALIRAALGTALFEINNQIITCPDVTFYAKDLAILEASRSELIKLIDKIDLKALTKTD